MACTLFLMNLFFFSSRRRHTRSLCDWSSDVCSSDLAYGESLPALGPRHFRRGHAARGRPEIGRASCRERVEISVGAGTVKKKKKTMRRDAGEMARHGVTRGDGSRFGTVSVRP